MWTRIRRRRIAGRQKNRSSNVPAIARIAEPLENRALLTTFVVNSLGDAIDPDDGVMTLREAITSANTLPDADTIAFSIPGTGVQTISPTSALPTIVNPVTIDGTTSPNFAGTPVIELDGSSAGIGVDGLLITGGDSTVRELVINRFNGNGILLDGGTGNVIEGNYIGTNSIGTAALGNQGHGILVNGSSNNTVGGTAAGTGNVLSGNGIVSATRDGIRIFGGSNNDVLGNLIGTNASGDAAIPNTNDGVHITGGSTNNTIGGTTEAARNTISGNAGDGVEIRQVATTGNVVIGNYIGINSAGTAALPNLDGVEIDAAVANTIGGTAPGSANVISGNTSDGIELLNSAASNIIIGNLVGTNPAGTAAIANNNNGIFVGDGSNNNVVGGTVAAARNIFSGNGSDGVELWDSTTVDNSVRGNYIGTNIDGSAAIPNGADGVRIGNGASNNTIGGIAVGAGNVISGNASDGIQIQNSGTTGNQVEGNLIGTNPAGTSALPNGNDGVIIKTGASTNIIGGTTVASRNLISGNTSDGVEINGVTSTGNRIEGNWIGVDITGIAALGNGSDGVEIDTTVGNIVGGTAAGAGNVIAFNTNDGIMVFGAASLKNSFQRNSIHSNGQRGIDLNNDGTTLNDADDADTGANGLTNFANLDSATANGMTTRIVGDIDALANTAYEIDFFSSPELDSTNLGEGQTYLGSTTVTTNGTGVVPIDFNLPMDLPNGTIITSTATDAAGNTSEFSYATRVNITDINLSVVDAYLINGLGERITDPVIGEEIDVRVEFTTDNIAAVDDYVITVSVDGVPLDSAAQTQGSGIGYGLWTYEVEGWYAEAGSHFVTVTVDSALEITESLENDNTAMFNYISASATDLPMKFIAPLGGTPFVDWNISNYVDLDPRPGSLRDYRGGEFSYDLTNYDHDGLDIGTGNFRAMDDQGIPIFAAADGVVTFT
jgi:CSLREA domain-containing protein